jgi:hypothetical protein
VKKTLLHLAAAFGAFLVGIFGAAFSQSVAADNARDRFFPVDANEIRDARIIDISLRLPRFTETFRACRPGYVQGYITNDGTKAFEGTCYEGRIPTRIIDRRKGRAVLEFIDEGEARYEIRKYERNRCSGVIGSPSLDVALELEGFLQK